MSISYEHPHAEKILKEAEKILEHSETAKKLITKLLAHPYSVNILATPVAVPFAIGGNNIYLSIPGTQDFSDIEQALDLASGHIELNLNREEEHTVTDLPGSEKFFQKHHLKNLNIMLEMFVIALELENEGYKSKESLQKIGLGKLFNSWQKGVDYQELINLYWEMI